MQNHPTIESRARFLESTVAELAEIIGAIVEHQPDAAGIVTTDGRTVAETVADVAVSREKGEQASAEWAAGRGDRDGRTPRGWRRFGGLQTSWSLTG
jgi:hypothetical protein